MRRRGYMEVDFPEGDKEAIISLIEDFRLWKEIRDYVRSKLFEFSKDWNKFEFVGKQVECGNERPHPPHVIDFYQKNDKTYVEFCLGKEGPTEMGELVIIREEEWIAGEHVHVKGAWRIDRRTKRYLPILTE